MINKKITIEQQDESFLITIECNKESIAGMIDRLLDIEPKLEGKKKS